MGATIEHESEQAAGILSAQETADLVSDEIERLFGMTPNEFAERVAAGEFEDHPATTQLALLLGVRVPHC